MKYNRKTWIYLAFTIFITLLILIINECIHPYFFFCDDNLSSYFTQYTYTIDCLKSFELPLYNFHRFMGIEFLSHGQTGLFDPVMYISYGLSNLLFGHSFAMIDLMSIIHLIIGGVGMFLVIKKLSGNNPAASMGAISWSLNSFVFFLGRSWLVVILTASVFPYILLGSLYLLTKKDFKALVISAVPKIICYMIVHHPQFFFYSVAADFVFVITYSIVTNKKESLKFFGKYMISIFISILSTVFLWFPSLISIISSSNRESSYDSLSLLSDKQNLFTLILGTMVPFLEDRSAVLISEEIQVRLGHIGYLIIIIVVIYIATYRRHIKEHKQILFSVISSFVAMTLIFLYSGFPPFIKLQAYMPILSNFRYIYKAMMFFHFFHILAGSLCLTVLMKSVWKNIKFLSTVLLTIHVLNFGLLYFICSPIQWGIPFDTDIPFKDEAVDIIKSDRYASACFTLYGDPEKNIIFPDNYAKSLAYNFSTYYGMDNYLGYDSIYPVEFAKQGNVTLNFDYKSIIELSPENIDIMRSNGVRWYIVNEYDNEKHDKTVKSLNERGVIKKFTIGDRSIYFDEKAPALVNHSGNPLDYSLTHNSINIKTHKDFSGGDISILYRYSGNFKTTIDGKIAAVSPAMENMGMVLNVPSGEHIIKIEYRDNIFTYTFICFIGTYALLFVAMVIFKSRFRKEPQRVAK